MYRFRVPEIFLGCFLTVAVFATGMLFNGQQSTQPQQAAKQQEAASQGHKPGSPDTELTESTWLTKDAAGFFTFGLVVVGIGQAFLFFIQLRYMRIGMRDATVAAKASKVSADAAIKSAGVAERSLTELERPWVFVFNVGRPTSDAHGGEFYIDYTVANYGKMPAIIDTPCIGFVFSDADGRPQAPMFPSEDHSLVAAPIMKAGEERRLREYFPAHPSGETVFRVINEGTPERSLERIPAVDLTPDLRLFFRAEITYRGPSSKGHETGANWLYRGPWDFVVRGDEYNYTR